MTKELGKIKSARFGKGGYQDVMFGLTLSFGGEAWGVGHFIGNWQNAEPQIFVDNMLAVDMLLEDAKVKSVDQLVGKPVEVEFDGNVFKSFRILKEVL